MLLFSRYAIAPLSFIALSLHFYHIIIIIIYLHTSSLRYIQDKRGDTPLHAAACNGSIECLLLLLQHGIDPRLSNNSGLKAIDLAVCNRHKRCKDILAEYHLHYCTSAEFDSMLFLATLQVMLLLPWMSTD